MSVVSAVEARSIVEAVLSELSRESAASAAPKAASPPSPPSAVTPAPGPAPTSQERPRAAPSIGGELSIEVPDPTVREERRRIGVENPANASGLANLAASTSARLAVGRAGPRPRTRAVLLFGADHAVTQDAIFGDVPTALLEQLGLFTVQTMVTSQDEFLLRPDLGRMLDDDAKKRVAEGCVKKPQVQIVVGDGLSAAAVTNTLVPSEKMELRCIKRGS